MVRARRAASTTKFTRHLEKRGVEVFYLDDLLTDVLKISEARVFRHRQDGDTLSPSGLTGEGFSLRTSWKWTPRRLATMLIGGLGRQEIDDLS